MLHIHGQVMPAQGYLAVDFFFILSGFVLCFGYEKKSRSNGYFWGFLRDRLIRLYPLHLLTLSVYVPMCIFFYMTSGGQLLEQNWIGFPINALLLQAYGIPMSGVLNAPSWSISVELFVNVFLALIIYALSRSKSVLIFVFFVVFGAYAASYASFGNLGGIDQSSLIYVNAGMLRGFGGIFLGVLIYHSYRAFERQVDRSPIRIALVAAIAASASIVSFLGMIWAWFPDFAYIPMFFAAILFTALWEKSAPISNKRLAAFFGASGALSYAVYLCHWPIITFIRYQLTYAWQLPVDIERPSHGAVAVLLILIISAFVHYRFELPIQRALRSGAKPAGARYSFG
ncbi:acyltransferase family protein [Rhizobium panacihumi]|uniref:acyltransferase family protein n=1 Tax=Rhizobium panacihumi TaxID=2008450 RepID=UPI003D7968AF